MEPITPKIAVDILPVFKLTDANLTYALLIEHAESRKVALVGGMVDVGETLKQSAAREVSEEIELKIEPSDLVYTNRYYDKADRDPRGHNVTFPFFVETKVSSREWLSLYKRFNNTETEEAKRIIIMDISDKRMNEIGYPEDFRFDHWLIFNNLVKDYRSMI